VQVFSAPFYIFRGEQMTYPIIGVTTSLGKNDSNLPISFILRSYIDALVCVGGTPVLLPSNLPTEAQDRLCEKLDGILFSGGGDIAHQKFGGQNDPHINGVDLERDSFELSLLDVIIQKKKPFFGICRGLQLINVGLGGTLYTHITNQIPNGMKHDNFPDYPRSHLAHTVNIVDDTILKDIIGKSEVLVNSLHHQGVKEIAKNLKPTAFAPDGLVEAVELQSYPFGIAVQWHPEWLCDVPVQRRLFEVFVKTADSYK
jgi:putative glutamine amidotransferase